MTEPNSNPRYGPPEGQEQQPPQGWQQPPAQQQPQSQQPPTQAQPQPAGQVAPLSAADDKQWAMLSHFLNIIMLIPALVIYLVFKDRGPLVNSESKEALNWTINATGAVVALNILIAILNYIPIVGFLAWLLLTLVIWAVIVVNIIFAIMGGMKVSGGGTYRYPINYRWIK